MFQIRKLLIITYLLTLPFVVFASTDQSERDRMMRDLDVIKQTFDVKYAPAEWKRSYTNWDLDDEIELAKANIQMQDTVTVKDYQRILLKFFNSTKDYHVGVSFYSTEIAALPFRVQRAGGKYYISWVETALTMGYNPIHLGDEVLTFDNLPIDDVVQELKRQEYGNWESATDQALAQSTLTLRIGSSGHLVPRGLVNLTLRHKEDGKDSTHKMAWYYVPELIPEQSDNGLFKMMAGTVSRFFYKKPLGEELFFYKDMSTPFYQHVMKGFRRLQESDEWDLQADGMEQFIGHKNSVLPNLGTLMKDLSDASFQAYIFQHNDKRVGFLRLPTFGAGKYEAQNFAKMIQVLESETDALVIDQLSNPGGSVFYMYAVASMLSDHPLAVPKQRMTITQEDVMFAVDNLKNLESIQSDDQAVSALGTNVGGYSVDYDLAQSFVGYFRFIRDEWKAGRIFTDADYLYGLDYLKPNPHARYTKPIMILVNELDFSCGDFFPAIMQDNQRATIVGSKTAGAGGYVLDHKFPNLYGVEGYTYTGSIAERDNHDPIENLGITPDISYELTERDMQNNYADYVEKIHETLDDILK